jgi:CheY-like chemotaxis protein
VHREGALPDAHMARIRVALAEDNALLREGISRIIDAEEEFELVGRAADLPQLLELIEEASPQVVVTDIRMPPTGTDEGIQAASWLREHKPDVGVVVLSQYKTPSSRRGRPVGRISSRSRWRGPTSWPRPSAPWPRAAPSSTRRSSTS